MTGPAEQGTLGLHSGAVSEAEANDLAQVTVPAPAAAQPPEQKPDPVWLDLGPYEEVTIDLEDGEGVGYVGVRAQDVVALATGGQKDLLVRHQDHEGAPGTARIEAKHQSQKTGKVVVRVHSPLFKEKA